MTSTSTPNSSTSTSVTNTPTSAINELISHRETSYKSRGRFRSVRSSRMMSLSNNSSTSSRGSGKRLIDRRRRSRQIPTGVSNKDFLRIQRKHSRQPSQSVMVRLKRLDTLRLNQRIHVKDFGYGMILFLGCVHFAQGLFVGVELDFPRGKHDGSFRGKRYFTSKERHGVLVKQHRVELIDLEIDDELDFQIPSSTSAQSSPLEQIQTLTKNTSSASNATAISISSPIAEELEYLRNECKMYRIDTISLNEKIDESLGIIELKSGEISDLKLREKELIHEKNDFETDMRLKLQELEIKLHKIRSELETKDNILQKQMELHESTKKKLRLRVGEVMHLKQSNADLIMEKMYGEKMKDNLIQNLHLKQQRYQEQVLECQKKVQQVKQECRRVKNSSVEEWLFDYGDYSLQM